VSAEFVAALRDAMRAAEKEARAGTRAASEEQVRRVLIRLTVAVGQVAWMLKERDEGRARAARAAKVKRNARTVLKALRGMKGPES